ncbi:MAG: DegT/DnrJ/EryC1/StrS family aminotransferase [Eubacteriales bacterium]
MKSETMTDVLNSGSWGTIGPHSLSGARALADYCGAGYCLLTHSASAAYETLLRAFEPVHGDFIITSSFSNPMLSLVPVCMGAAPLFCDIEAESVLISSESLIKTLESSDISHVKAVVVDFIGGICPELIAVGSICKKYNLPLILNSGDAFNILYNGMPLTKYADAVICSLDASSALNIGNGGAVLTDNADIFTGASAYHHCGNSINVGSMLNLKDIIGGDFRITEFQACLVAETIPETVEIIKSRAITAAEAIKDLSCAYLIPVSNNRPTSSYSIFFNYISEKNDSISTGDYIRSMNSRGIMLQKGYSAMHRQPVFKSEYFYKMTGFTSSYCDNELKNSVFAEENYLRLDL